MLVLLDRDGVINYDSPSGILRMQDFVFLPRAVDAIKLLTEHNIQLAICTNQSAVGRGLMSSENLQQINDYMLAEIRKYGGDIAKIYVATDTPEQPSTRRKPAPGMLLEALADFGAKAKNTPFVGDMPRDMQAAYDANCPRIMVKTGKGEQSIAQNLHAEFAPVTICDDLFAAAEYILANYSVSK